MADDAAAAAQRGASSTAVRAKLALLLRRRVGSMREDKDFDTLLRLKHVHVTVFSMVGVVTMFVVATTTWFYNVQMRNINFDVYFDDETADPTMLNLMQVGQAIVSASTLVTLILITQKYNLLLIEKRAEWSGVNVFEVESLRGDTAADDNLRVRFNTSYSFWRSSMKWRYLLEMLVHIPHPVMWMARQSTVPNIGFKLLQLFMFTRLYLFIPLQHLFSLGHQNRFEIINSDKELVRVNFRLTSSLTIKMFFYAHTTLSIVMCVLGTIFIFGYSMFSIERNETGEENTEFGKSENAFWYTYITFSTVGYGDYAPGTQVGRIVAFCIGCVGITAVTIFSGVLTNRMALSKEQKHAVEYLNTMAANEDYRAKASELVFTALMTYLRPRLRTRRGVPIEPVVPGHKGNLMYKAIKEFRRARRRLESALMQAEDSVVNEKVEAVEEIAAALTNNVIECEKHLEDVETVIQGRMRELLNVVASFGKTGAVPL